MALLVFGVTVSPELPERSTVAAANGTEDKISLYLSAPEVQGSGVETASLKENFNAFPAPTEPCPTTSAVGGMTFRSGDTVSSTPGASCEIKEVGVYAGASSESSEPVTSGVGTRSIGVPFPGGAERAIIFTLAENAKYVGFWWSAGNDGNIVRFYDAADNLLAEFDSQSVVSKLPKGSPASVDSIGTPVVAHPIAKYYGNPVVLSRSGTEHLNFIYSYLNLFLEGSLGVRKIEFAGPGFEFDNLAVSTISQTPTSTMVKVMERTSPSLSWNPVLNHLLSAGSATVSPATNTGGGAITYSVKNAGATGCTVNPSTGSLTSYSAVGNCIVTATSAGVGAASASSGFLKTSIDVTFVISETLPVQQGSGASGQTPAVAKTNRAVLISGGFEHNSRKLTPKMKRKIDRWLAKHPDLKTVTCTGFTSLPRRTSDVRLSTNRGITACSYAKSKRPDRTTSVSKGKEDPRPGSNVRRVRLVLTP